jgi:hypothetical protein
MAAVNAEAVERASGRAHKSPPAPNLSKQNQIFTMSYKFGGSA